LITNNISISKELTSSPDIFSCINCYEGLGESLWILNLCLKK